MLRAVSDVPVIIASARDDDPSLVGALDAGADDYVVKPYTTAQLEARIRAVMRRTSSGAGARRTLVVGGLEVDVAARRATLDDDGAGPEPAGVRPADLPGRAARRRGDQAAAAHRRVAPGLGRLGQDGRRAPVVAAPQAGRDGVRAAVPDHRPRGRRPARPNLLHEAPADRHRRGGGVDGAARDAGADGRPGPQLRPGGPALAGGPGGAGDRDGGVRARTRATCRSTSTRSTPPTTAPRRPCCTPTGPAIGPNPGEDDRVAEARRTGQARVDDVGGGAQILVPVSLGGSTGQPRETPVIRVDVQAPGLASGVGRAWLLLATLGVVLLGRRAGAGRPAGPLVRAAAGGPGRPGPRAGHGRRRSAYRPRCRVRRRYVTWPRR